MHVFEGKAVIFNSQEEACEGILQRKIKPGDVVVIRYEGPKGDRHAGNARADILYHGAGLGEKVALITDGRFPAAPEACIGHVSPEAAAGTHRPG